MTFYRVSFYKHLLSSDGHPFRCLQQSIKIGRARSIERAVLAAKHRFERRRGLPAWDLHADDIDVEIGENELGYMPSHSATPLSLEAMLSGRHPPHHQAESQSAPMGATLTGVGRHGPRSRTRPAAGHVR